MGHVTIVTLCGILCCTVLVALLEGFNVWRFLFRGALQTTSFLKLVNGNHFCFLCSLLPILLPGLICLTTKLIPIFHNVSLLEDFLNAAPHCCTTCMSDRRTANAVA